MLAERHLEKLKLRFPYLFTGGLDRELLNQDSDAAARAEARLVESLLRFLSALFVTQVFRRGAGDDRVTQFIDEDLGTVPVESSRGEVVGEVVAE